MKRLTPRVLAKTEAVTVYIDHWLDSYTTKVLTDTIVRSYIENQ